MKSNYLLVFTLFVIMIATAICSYGQLSLSPNQVFAQCPNQPIQYTVTNSVTPSCIYDWTVTKGSIQGGSQNGDISTFTGGNLVIITWFDVTTSGQIQVTARNCDNANGNSSLSLSIPILSINGVNPGTMTGASTVTVNVTTNQDYEIPQINFPNTGSGDPNPFPVSSYDWESRLVGQL